MIVNINIIFIVIINIGIRKEKNKKKLKIILLTSLFDRNRFPKTTKWKKNLRACGTCVIESKYAEYMTCISKYNVNLGEVFLKSIILEAKRQRPCVGVNIH